MKLEERVAAIIEDSIEKKRQIEPGLDLRKDLEIDSLGTILIMNALEDAFGIAIDEDDFTKVSTVEDVCSLLRNRYGVAQSA
jgi:acyl carrier protein